jgi:hypothetical protein
MYICSYPFLKSVTGYSFILNWVLAAKIIRCHRCMIWCVWFNISTTTDGFSVAWFLYHVLCYIWCPDVWANLLIWGKQIFFIRGRTRGQKSEIQSKITIKPTSNTQKLVPELVCRHEYLCFIPKGLQQIHCFKCSVWPYKFIPHSSLVLYNEHIYCINYWIQFSWFLFIYLLTQRLKVQLQSKPEWQNL